MTNAEETDREELQFRKTKYPRFRVATGGKGPEDPTDAFDWLSGYEVGTTFVTFPRSSLGAEYEHFFVLFKSLPEVILLKWILPDGKTLDRYVRPEKFCKQYEPGIILGIEKPQGEDNDGNRSD